jgi:radical SAM superfamily enzyme with C-terminal helix-hairpin-helix motif
VVGCGFCWDDARDGEENGNMSREADRIVEKWEQVQEQKKMEARLGNPQNIFAKVLKEMSKPKTKPKPKKK